VTSAEHLLLQFDAADQARRPDREPFWVAAGMSPLPGVPVQHGGLEPDFRCAEQDIMDLADAGHLRVNRSGERAWSFDVTSAGHDHAEKLRLAITAPVASADPTPVNVLDWEARALPVLQAVGRAYSKQPHPLGVASRRFLPSLALTPIRSPSVSCSTTSRAPDSSSRPSIPISRWGLHGAGSPRRDSRSPLAGRHPRGKPRSSG
jgi:hypothetical protein